MTIPCHNTMIFHNTASLEGISFPVKKRGRSNQTANTFGALQRLYRCIKWEKLTDFSFSYLIYANMESNAQNQRILVQPDTDTFNISSGCTPTNGLPTAVETIVLVKKGYIQNAAQNCPTPFLGRFHYSFNDGSSTFCDGTSMWDVCTDRTQMVVNYTLCSTKQFYSKGGVAYCVYSTSVGRNHYVTVVNADSTVDFSTTFRFTCYAVTTSGRHVLASDNKGACVENQTPQKKSATGTGTLTFSSYGVERCSLPVEWDGEWHDSSDTEQDITFTRSSSYVEGWKHTIYLDTVTSWTCVDQDTSNNLLLFKSKQTVDKFGVLQRLYRCIKWEKLTDFSYSYLIYADHVPNAQNRRILATLDSDSVDISSGCNPTNGLPTAVETIVLVKKGFIQNAAQNCPTPFLGTFNYSFNDGSSTFCDFTSMWDVCTDRAQMVVNYTLCSTKQFYSNGGVAYCVYSTSVGRNHYVTVVNADSTVDFNTTYRFTCYAVTTSGGYVLASDNKGACVQEQTPQKKSATGTGTLTFSSYGECRVERCSLPVEWDGEWHDSSDTEQDITFSRSSSYVEGWKHTGFLDTVTSWTCVDQDTSNNLLLFKSKQIGYVFGARFRMYRCIKWEKLTDFSYSYLIYADHVPNAQNRRILVLPDSDSVDISSGCNPTNGLPTAVETIVLVKKGYIQNAAQNCPTPFLGTFNYSFNDGSSTFCDGTSMWDVCTDRTQMVVNYTLCSTKQFYSSCGVAYCVYSTSVGRNHYVTVVNADSTVDFSTTFRFTCYAVTMSGRHVLASDNKGACVQDQTPQKKSATGTGILTLSSYGESDAVSQESSSINPVALCKRKSKVRIQSKEHGLNHVG
ncbi:uncharacterized protein LOC111125499 isoform X3 [Crassostrea virginica]